MMHFTNQFSHGFTPFGFDLLLFVPGPNEITPRFERFLHRTELPFLAGGWVKGYILWGWVGLENGDIIIRGWGTRGILYD